MSLGTYPAVDLAGARAAWRAAREAVANGRDPATEKTAARNRIPDTVRAVGEQFIEKYARPKNRTWKAVSRMFELHLYPVLGDRDITTVTRRDILALLDAAEAKGLGAGANRVLANTASLFSWAIQRGIIEASPVTSVKPPAVEQRRDRVLDDAEVVAFWHACDLVVGQPFAAILKLLLMLGQRRSEVSAARWSEFDLARRSGACLAAGPRTRGRTSCRWPRRWWR